MLKISTKSVKIIFVVITLFAIAFAALLYYRYDAFIQKGFIHTANQISPDKVHIFMAFDPKYGKLIGDKTSVINKQYADKYAFHFHKLDPDSKKYVFPHYKRYIALQELLAIYPDDHYFIYIDGDAEIIHSNLDVRNWIPDINSATDVLLGNQNSSPPLSRIKIMLERIILQKITFNSGVIIVRNNQWSREFIANVLDPQICNHAQDHTRLFKNYFHTKDQNCIGLMYADNKHSENLHIKVIPFSFDIQVFTRSGAAPKALIYHAAGERKYDT